MFLIELITKENAEKWISAKDQYLFVANLLLDNNFKATEERIEFVEECFSEFFDEE